MERKTLRLKDGFANTSPHLREEVRILQQTLTKAGYAVDTDGLFGDGTKKAVEALQKAKGLGVDGVAGPNTWLALEGRTATGSKVAAPNGTLGGFRGDLSWVHEREGHAGKAYWPGGASGVTLDPGIDLGHAMPELIKAAYKGILTTEQFSAVGKVLGIKGEAAKAALAADPILQSIRISKQQADDIFQYGAQPYWEAIVKRFPALADADTLGEVQTALLSLAYNRGARNKGLEPLKAPIESKRWADVAKTVGSMQQDHRLEGIRRRRQLEAGLIDQALA